MVGRVTINLVEVGAGVDSVAVGARSKVAPPVGLAVVLVTPPKDTMP